MKKNNKTECVRNSRNPSPKGIHIKLVKISKGSHSNFSEIDQKVYYKLKSIKCLFNKMYGNYNNSGRPFSILSLTPIPSKIQSCLWKNNYLVYFLSFFFFSCCPNFIWNFYHPFPISCFLLSKWKVKVLVLSHVHLFLTPWTVAHQAPLSMGFSW